MAFSRKLEVKTLDKMISIYCYDKHGSKLCSDCDKLLKYAEKRIANCVYGDDKPVCSKCPVHCYKSDMRESIKTIMRYSGPKMLWKSPLLALRYFFRKIFKNNAATSIPNKK